MRVNIKENRNLIKSIQDRQIQSVLLKIHYTMSSRYNSKYASTKILADESEYRLMNNYIRPYVIQCRGIDLGNGYYLVEIVFYDYNQFVSDIYDEIER